MSHLPQHEACAYRIAGPLMCGFVDWLTVQLRAKPVDQILFLARDARVFYELWRLRCPDDLRDIPADYWKISRRALQVASLRDLMNEELEFLASRLKGMSAAQIQDDLHLPMHPGLLSQKKLDEAGVKSLLASLRSQLKEQAKSELAGMQRYLHATVTGNHVALVDVGWHGTMQNLIEFPALWKLRSKPTFSGFYLGLLRSGPDRCGYCCDPGTSAARIQVIGQMVYFIEAFTAGNEPYLVRIDAEDGGKHRLLFAEGCVEPRLAEIFTAFRNGILRYAKTHPHNVSLEQALAAVLRPGLAPSKEERDLISQVQIGTFGQVKNLPLLDTDLLASAQWWPPALTRLLRGTLWPGAAWQELSPAHRALARWLAPGACGKISAALKSAGL